MLYRHHTEEQVRGYRERLASRLGPGLAELLRSFDAYMKRRGLTTDTRYTHLTAVFGFLEYLSGRGLSSIAELRVEHVRGWMDSVVDEYAPMSASRKFMVVKGFLRWLIEERGLELEECYRAVRRLKVKRVLPEVLSEREVVELVGRLGRLRDRALVALLYETAARKSEILSLRVGDVELGADVSYVTIRSSKSEPRRVPVIVFNRLLHEYLASHPAAGDPEAYLFHSPRDPHRPLSHSAAGMLFWELSKKLGRRIHPHLLRHSRATHLLKMGLAEKELMYLLGEKTRDMVDVYVTITARDVDEKLRKLYGLGGEELEVVKCPRCGQPLPSGAEVCTRCGLPMEAQRQRTLLKEAVEDREVIEVLRYLVEVLNRNPKLKRELLGE